MSEYQVLVGNIGTVLVTNNRNDAVKVYGEYKKLSLSEFGRAGGEDVTLFCDNEIMYEHQGTINQE